jgi:hypothetical protein
MRRYTFIIIAAFIFLLPQTNCASPSPDTAALLENLFRRILNTNSDDERLRLNDSVKVIIDSYAISDSVFVYKFSGLRYLGQILSPDSQVKIITWNLILREGGNKYFCYIIRRGERGMPNAVYKLTGENREEKPEVDRVYSEKEWYGALYYALQPFKKDKQTHYLILGLDYGSSPITRKIIDVLTFTPEGAIVFGNNCFSKGENLSSRVVIEYFSEGVISLRMLSAKSVVFDHLASISDDKKSDPEFMGSDYSFDGYALKKGLWRFVSNVDARNKKQLTSIH